jgi:hypothetical protein
VDVFDGPVVVLSVAELAVLGRKATRAIKFGWTVRGKPPPRELLDFAIALNRLTSGTCGTGHEDIGAGQETAMEPWNTRVAPGAGVLTEPATLTVKEAAQATEVSESYLRRLVRVGILEVQDSQGPGYAICADSLTVWWQERRHRIVND